MPVQQIILIVMLVLLMLSSVSLKDSDFDSGHPRLARFIAAIIYIVLIALAMSI